MPLIAVALRGDRGLEHGLHQGIFLLHLIAVALRGDRGLEPRSLLAIKN